MRLFWLANGWSLRTGPLLEAIEGKDDMIAFLEERRTGIVMRRGCHETSAILVRTHNTKQGIVVRELIVKIA